MDTLNRITTAICVTILVAGAGAWLLFGWSGTGWKALAIPTGSMRPAIPPGSMVFVHRIPASDLKVGDVITYTNPRNKKETISHRIASTYLIGGKIPGYVTKGDANSAKDVPIPAGLVQGKVVWHMPYAGYGLMDAKKPIVILPIIYIAALLIMVEEVARLAEYYRRWIVYRLPGYRREPEVEHTVAKRIGMAGALTTAFVFIGLAFSPVALAAFKSNTVVLAHNKISAAKISSCEDHGKHKGNDGKCDNKCDGDHDKDDKNCQKCGDGDHDKDDKNCHQQCSSQQSNNVHVSTTTTQTATTGNAKSTGSGNATSGNASNSSTSNININVSNSSTHC